MRLETVPLIIGFLVALLGLGLLFDAWTPDEIIVKRERRRRPRIERHRGGEAAVGIGVLCMAAAWLGRDTWDYSIIAVIAGCVFLLYGAWRNSAYLGETISNRGPLRRRQPAEENKPLTNPAGGVENRQRSPTTANKTRTTSAGLPRKSAEQAPEKPRITPPNA